MSFHQTTSRRRFLQYLAGSPVFASTSLASIAAFAEGLSPPPKLADPVIWAPGTLDLIKSPKEAINVFDFEPVARKNVPPAHFGYMASGIDDEVTLRANREGFLKFQLRPRRLNDVAKIDQSIELFGEKWDSPIGIAPTGGNRAYDAEGEIAVSKAAKVGNHFQIISTQASTSVDDAIRARQQPIWFQLYATPSWDIAKALVKRAEQAGSPVVAVTVDRVGGRNQETFLRLIKQDPRACSGCHDNSSLQGSVKTKPNFEGIDVSGVRNLQSANMTWDFVKRLRDFTKMKIVLKGILVQEDAQMAAESGIVDGIIVSNHGGRSEDSGRSTIDALPEIVQAVNGRIPIVIDSGFRRGTDVVKALAIGANAVCIGRPYLWGLGAFGQAGVERVLELMRIETSGAMAQCGVRTVRELTPAYVRRA